MLHIALLLSALLTAACSAEHYLTGETGHRTGTNQNSQTATETGGILLQDVYALEKLRRFNTERIPERVVHARGAAAHGVFESYGDHSDLTSAAFLGSKGMKTELFTRFSTVIHGKGSPETLRDPRGFAVKFKTETEGNWDLVGNNLAVFFIRDHIKFPDVIHSLKPDPITNIQDPNRFFDLFSALGGMATNMLTHLYSDLGIPKAYRFMDGNGVHAYKMVNAQKDFVYVKFRWFTMQGVQNLTVEEAAEIQAMDFNHATRDLNDAIMSGDYPSWELGVQVMDPAKIDDFDFNPLDSTKLWPDDMFPIRILGKMTLNRVPDNFHLGSEQSAFSPGNYLPGAIEPSEDRMLQGRLISYHESQVHRHGSALFNHLPVNKAKSPIRNYNQDGIMVREHNWNGSVNYEPNNDPNGYKEDPSYLYSTKEICGTYMQQPITKTLNFGQAGDLYRSFSMRDKENLIKNLAGDLGKVKSMLVKNIMCAHFTKADADYGQKIVEAVSCDPNEVAKIAEGLKE